MSGFRKAERRKAKLRLGLVGSAGSGKTYSALLIAFGIGGKVALIDTENGSGDLYAHLGDYDVCTIGAPYTVEKYLTAIAEAERAGYDVLIIDSLSHAWAGDGGLLDQQGRIADSGRANNYTAWRQVTPLHNRLVEVMLTSKCHIIATMRAKTEYVIEKDSRGRDVPRKVGMAPVQRDGMDYEFGVVFDIDINHTATVSKDRTTLFDGQIFTPSTETGKALKDWLESGSEPLPTPKRDTAEINRRANGLYQEYLDYYGDKKMAQAEMKAIADGKEPKQWTVEDLDRMGIRVAEMRASASESATEQEPQEQPRATSKTDRIARELGADVLTEKQVA